MAHNAGDGDDIFGPLHTHCDRWRLLAMMSLCVFSASSLSVLFGSPLLRWISVVYFSSILISSGLCALFSQRLRIGSQLTGIILGLICLPIALSSVPLADLWPWGSWAVQQFKALLANQTGGRSAPFDQWIFVQWQLLNMVLLLALPLWMALVAFIVEKISTVVVDRDPLRIDIITKADQWLINATFANAAGWIALLLPIILVFALSLGATQNPDWTYNYLREYTWCMVVAPILYLGFSVQRRPETSAESMPASAADDANKAPPVRPLYTAYTQEPDLKPHVLYPFWPEAGLSPDDKGREASRRQRRETDLSRLMEGKTVVRYGNPDAKFYRLVSGVVSRAQDRGQACVLICPDKSGSRIKEHLQNIARFEFPEIARRIVLWEARQGDDFPADVATIFDFVITEESAFLRIVTQSSQFDRDAYLDHILHRTAVFVAIDYHAIDASRLYLALREIDNSKFPVNVGILMQCYEHHKIDSQIQKIRSLINQDMDNPYRAETGPLQVKIGWIVLRASQELRLTLLIRHGYPQGPTGNTTAPYLVLKSFGSAAAYAGPAQAALALPTFILMSKTESRIAEGLRNGLRQNAMLREAELFRPHQSSHHYAPRSDIRVVIVPDDGNFIDPLSQDYAFWAEDNDYLVFIVSQGYLGRRYLQNAVEHDHQQTLPHLRPMAQEPGIGITDIAGRLSMLLSRPEGLSERKVEELMQMPSGKIRDYIDVTPTRRGLALLFSIIKPGQRLRIETTFDTTQSATFKLSHRATLIDDDIVHVIEEGTRNKLTEIALADEGLLFCEGEEVRLGDYLLRLERVARKERIVTAGRLDANNAQITPEPRHYFRRRYRILAREPATGSGDEPRFVGERGINPSGSYGLTCYCGHIHVAITRTSDAYMSLSSDDEPEPDAVGMNCSNLNPAIEHRRPFRSICILAFEDPHSEYRENRVLCETLAASLQVVLGLSFPMIRQRIAVIPLEVSEDPYSEEKKPYASSFLFPQGTLEGESVAAILSRLHRSGESSKDTWLKGSALRGPFVSFAVIEDSVTDLGVSRRVHDDIREVITRWRLFLAWAGNQPGWTVEGLLDAKDAAQFPGLIRRA